MIYISILDLYLYVHNNFIQFKSNLNKGNFLIGHLSNFKLSTKVLCNFSCKILTILLTLIVLTSISIDIIVNICGM